MLANQSSDLPMKARCRPTGLGWTLKYLTLVPAVRRLAKTLDAKDRYTHGHSLRVSACAGAIAMELGLSQTEAMEIRLAGELHDIGKIGVPEALLRKSDRLTAKEYQAVIEHTSHGAKILLPLFGPDSTVVKVAKWHHERWDGEGSPDGLRGDEIPLAVRIVTVADSFDAMTSSRPYRMRRSHDDTLQELQTHAGTQFDPACVTALFSLIRRTEQFVA